MPDAEWIDIDSVEEHPANPRVGYLPAIREAMVKNGWHGSLVVQKSTRRILAGNHRWRVAKELGLKRVLAHVVDVSDKVGLRILLADNRTADRATYNDPKLSEVLSMIIADEPDPKVALEGSGYSDDDAEQLALALSGGEAMEWGSQGTAEQSAEVYANSPIRQIVWVMSAEQFDTAMGYLDRIIREQSIETISAALGFLLDQYVSARGWAAEEVPA